VQEEDQPHAARREEAAGCAKAFRSCHRQPGNVHKEHPRSRTGMCRNRHRQEGRRKAREEAKPLPFGCYINILRLEKPVLDRGYR
jgi:hypothetical protein